MPPVDPPPNAATDSPPDVGARSDAGRRHRVLAATLLTLAVLCGVVALMSTWVKRQVLDTGNWTNTSSRLLADPTIQAAVGGYLVEELFNNVDIAANLRARLPAQLKPVAGPAAAGLEQVAERAAPRLLARPRVQDAWRLANREAHAQLVRILNGGSGVVSTTNGQVTLNLQPLVTQLAASVGLQQQLAAARAKLTPQARVKARAAAARKGITLPSSTGQLVILRSNQLKAAQNGAAAIKGVSVVFTALAFGLFALAVWFARGWRRVALRRVGWCLFGVGFVTLALRRFGGNHLVDALVKSDSARPAAHDAWSIGTSLLRAIALALVIYGLAIVLSAWLAGPTRSATGVRRALAPTLRDHPARVYATAAFAYLLLLLWGPTPAFRHWIPVLLIAAVLVLGIEVLRRQAGREWPDEQPGDARQRLGQWYANRRAPAAAPVQNGDGARVEQLERLAALRERGVLTDSEYQAEKLHVLGGGAGPLAGKAV